MSRDMKTLEFATNIIFNELQICPCSDLKEFIDEMIKFLEWCSSVEDRVPYSELYKNNGTFYIISSFFTKHDLINHGSRIRYPFLTPKGKTFLKSLKEISPEEIRKEYESWF